MHILQIAYHFPPDPAVGALRAAKVAETLAEAGHEVTVITACLPGEQPGARETSRPFSVRTVQTLPGLREAYLSAKAKIRRRNETVGEVVGSGDAAEYSEVGRLKRYILAFLWLPDDRQGFILPAMREARRAIRGAGVDVLYTTAPPFSVHLVGMLLKRLTGIRWVVEFRDPWTTNPSKPRSVRSQWSDSIERWLEARCLERADQVICVSEGIRRQLASQVGSKREDRVLLVRNGIDHLREDPPPRSRKPVRVAHVGTFYHGRDPRPLLLALAAEKKRAGLSSEDIVVDFVGHCRTYRDVSLEGMVEELGLTGMVRFRDWIPHLECVRLVESADLLLLFAQDQPDQVPNKLYEYLGARVPIVAIADADGEVADMLRRVGGHYVVTDNNAENLEIVLRTALADRATPTAESDVRVLREWGSAHQMQRLLAAVGD